ncbi:cell division ATP-binding protein FtsE [bacterium (Candidatus Gribaldobacteria) CG07_land_8_20_14_0_80_33_18]|uniref:Cell division ATP-binding protein FtsE n=1 Tax=bacterium (Candidatus Gribaldobacteria) CG07_land_8_20_14_0_80_33_18 TaxID=2014272 RepID=A0A2M6Z481_9BACT|nr:MAG: cell division ATP-binding protein FtsE [bacterium (Candidatus Gribaldobacteria) CG10_big_fil_rev_8_21_14_0_10_33_41]PIU47145.1 MAG: cell division ATP-binding protein FtsE [bacterium (Candidatus Gribaldobacteria) CG07_land_8_20_14_0_80_33_18]PJA01260.1 MAG: cell division ATP-binding protein FtsE [bacterium (Candidatus Gribaldobacteria) CG_4_10_14_0_2_um_filter_33_15]
MIKFKNVTKIYCSVNSEQITALENVSFDIQPKEFVSIVGKSGAGKTTLIKLLMGEEKLTSGEIFFDGINVSKIKPKELQELRRRIGVVFQDYKLLPTKTVYENVSYVMQVIGTSDIDIKRDIPQVLEMVGLDQRAFNFPCELSGGEQQRLAIARALIHRPEVIIADEPTGNLDVYNTFEIVNLLKKIHNFGTTIILATHDKTIVDSLKKRVIALNEGKLIRDDHNGNFIF